MSEIGGENEAEEKDVDKRVWRPGRRVYMVLVRWRGVQQPNGAVRRVKYYVKLR